jgi:iron complex outermembrane receptor protein
MHESSAILAPRKPKYTVLCSAILGLLTAQAASAAEQAAPAGAADSGEDITEIIVTSRLRAERLQDVPVSVSVFTEQAIRDAGIRRPADFIALTPNVTVAEAQDVGNVAIVVRGIGQIRNGETPVAVSIDGVLQASPLQFNQDLFDVQQIEVLKGPQGALYGRNAIAGAINITTKRPTDTFEGTAEIGFGNGEQRSLLASVSGPLAGDRVVFRAAIQHKEAGGWITNSFLDKKVDDYENQTGVLRIDANLTDRLRLDARVAHGTVEGGAAYFVVASNANRNGATPFTTAKQIANHVIAPSSNNLGSNDRNTTDLSLKLDYDLAGGVLSSISSLSRVDNVVTFDGFDYSDNTQCVEFSSPLNVPYACATPQFTIGGLEGGTPFFTQAFNTTFQDYELKNFSQEIRFTSRADSRWRYIVGAYYLKRDRDLTTATQEDRGFGIIPKLDFDPATANQTRSYFAEVNRDKAYAVFGQLNIDLTSMLELGLALRYDEDKRHQTDPRPDAYRVDGFGLPIVGPRSKSEKFSQLQPKVTLAWKPSRELTVYGSVASGFRSGGFNAPGTEVSPFTGEPIADPVYKKETSQNYEIGIKSQLLDRRLTVNAAVFRTDAKDLQVFNFNGAVNAQVVNNVDKVVINGAELEITALATDWLTLFGGVGYSDAEIKRYEDNPAAVGNQVPYNTKLKFTVGAQVRRELVAGLSGVARVDLEHRGKTYFHEGGHPIGIPVRDPVDLLGARLGIETKDGWSVMLWGRNLTDEKYYEEVVVPDFAFQARPRSYGVDVRKSF